MKSDLFNRKFSDGLIPLILLSAAFSIGLICGFLLALLNSPKETLTAYLQQYLHSLSESAAITVTLWSVVWDVIQWPLLFVCLGSTQFCLIAVPAALFFRAFLLSYTVSIFARLFAGKGLLVALISFGVIAVLVIPVLFVIAFTWMELAVRRNYGKSNVLEFSQERLVIFLMSIGVLIFAVFIQWTIMPPVLALVCAGF